MKYFHPGKVHLINCDPRGSRLPGERKPGSPTVPSPTTATVGPLLQPPPVCAPIAIGSGAVQSTGISRRRPRRNREWNNVLSPDAQITQRHRLLSNVKARPGNKSRKD
jgi:hypothetical protein